MENTSRREFVRSLAAAASATLLLPEPRGRASSEAVAIVHPPAKADAIIVLWMAGGMAAPDTFDPKKLDRICDARSVNLIKIKDP